MALTGNDGQDKMTPPDKIKHHSESALAPEQLYGPFNDDSSELQDDTVTESIHAILFDSVSNPPAPPSHVSGASDSSDRSSGSTMTSPATSDTNTAGKKPFVRPSISSIPPPALSRAKVGRYEVIYPMAAGGMASVHLGRLSGLAGFERLVAIKIIHPHLSNQKLFVDMFLDEARLAGQLHHPNIGEIIEVGEDGGQLYMVGELIMGRNL
ncbi:MAG: hypothetical protein JXX14_13270, partial [Deltaproteobacteria bacterium]|nr:hypothetical protein [Deltaproteobacteria bacterium]